MKNNVLLRVSVWKLNKLKLEWCSGFTVKMIDGK